MFEADMTAQQDRLLHALLAAVRALDRPELVEDHLRRWGGRLSPADVRGDRRDVRVRGGMRRRATTVTLAGPPRDQHRGRAGSAVYEWMAAVMIDGAQRADVVDRDPSTLIAQQQFYSEARLPPPSSKPRPATCFRLRRFRTGPPEAPHLPDPPAGAAGTDPALARSPPFVQLEAM